MCIRDSINSNKAVDFEPGDVIWMPLYADDQKVYTVDGAVENGQDEVAATTITLNVAEQGQAKVGEVEVDKNGTVLPFSYTDELNKVVYYYDMVKPGNKDGWRYVELKRDVYKRQDAGRGIEGLADVCKPYRASAQPCRNASGICCPAAGIIPVQN